MNSSWRGLTAVYRPSRSSATSPTVAVGNKVDDAEKLRKLRKVDERAAVFRVHADGRRVHKDLRVGVAGNILKILFPAARDGDDLPRALRHGGPVDGALVVGDVDAVALPGLQRGPVARHGHEPAEGAGREHQHQQAGEQYQRAPASDDHDPVPPAGEGHRRRPAGAAPPAQT